MDRNSYIFLIILLAGILLIGITWWTTYSIREQYLQDDPKLRELKEKLLPLDPTVKTIKLYKGDKSYTINKEKIYLCLKDEHNNYYSDNILIYVLIHEIAHLLNRQDVGHTPKFHQIFEELLDKAAKLGVYDPSVPMIQNYCNHTKDD